jgi:hypothetical protein
MDQSHVPSTKRSLSQKRRELTIDHDLSAADFDDVYLEFIKNSGQRTKKWTFALFNDILTSGNPKLFKRAKIIRSLNLEKMVLILRTLYRPISLLSIVFKILEQMILQPLIDAVVSMSQAGFRKNRSCTEQVLALTSHIEAGFQRKLKLCVVYLSILQLCTIPYG